MITEVEFKKAVQVVDAYLCQQRDALKKYLQEMEAIKIVTNGASRKTLGEIKMSSRLKRLLQNHLGVHWINFDSCEVNILESYSRSYYKKCRGMGSVALNELDEIMSRNNLKYHP